MFMTNQDILRIAMEQSAIDCHCAPEDFLRSEHVVVHSTPDDRARRYLSLPLACDLVSYGSNIVASVVPELEDDVRAYINRYEIEHCFETPNLYTLNEALAPHGQRVCFMAEYFLPRVELLHTPKIPYEMRLLAPPDFDELYLPQWSHALCAPRRELDILGVGAYHQGQLIGLAGCSRDCDTMWQIGIDVLPEYRGQGVATALTSRLAQEILARGKVPFYCAAWCNVRSVRTALASGFRPAWVEITAKSDAFIRTMLD